MDIVDITANNCIEPRWRAAGKQDEAHRKLALAAALSCLSLAAAQEFIAGIRAARR
jgi:hypothetical protein